MQCRLMKRWHISMESAASIFRLEMPSDGRGSFLHIVGTFPLPPLSVTSQKTRILISCYVLGRNMTSTKETVMLMKIQRTDCVSLYSHITCLYYTLFEIWSRSRHSIVSLKVGNNCESYQVRYLGQFRWRPDWHRLRCSREVTYSTNDAPSKMFKPEYKEVYVVVSALKLHPHPQLPVTNIKK
jgi:hypothetical protein